MIIEIFDKVKRLQISKMVTSIEDSFKLRLIEFELNNYMNKQIKIAKLQSK